MEIQQFIEMHYRYLHQNPEIGYETKNTAAYLKKQLQSLGYDVYLLCNDCAVLASYSLNKPHTIAFRSDMDALAISEATHLSFQSKNHYMHACGHDAHMAMLLGAAKLISEHKKALNCNVKLIFQMAEEGPLPGGALPIIQTGMLQDVNCFYAFHVTRKLKSHTVGIKKCEACAAPDLWEATLCGKGCHGAAPENGINPILMGSEVVQVLQDYADNLKKSIPFSVISTTYFQSGVSMNIIPNICILKGTARSFTNTQRKQIHHDMESILHEVSVKYHGSYSFTFHYAYDPVFNDEESVEYAKECIQKVNNLTYLQLDKPEMVGEDFAYYRKIAPICLMWFGVREEQGAFIDLHNASFYVDEKALLKGSQLFLQLALNYK